MSSARENAQQLLDGVVFSHTEPATEVAAVAQAEATLAVADEIAKLREALVLADSPPFDSEIRAAVHSAPVESEEKADAYEYRAVGVLANGHRRFGPWCATKVGAHEDSVALAEAYDLTESCTEYRSVSYGEPQKTVESEEA